MIDYEGGKFQEYLKENKIKREINSINDLYLHSDLILESAKILEQK